MTARVDGILAIVLLIFIILSLAFIVALYVIHSLGLSKIAKRNNHGYPWIAWIPIANTFLMAMLIESPHHNALRKRFTLFYTLAFIGLFFIPFASIILSVLYFYSFYVIARWYSKNPVIHLVLGILTSGFSIPVSLFMFRNQQVISH